MPESTVVHFCPLQDQPGATAQQLIASMQNIVHNHQVALFVFKVTHVTYITVINTSKEANSAFIYLFYCHQAVS